MRTAKDRYRDHEKACERIRAANAELLREFEADLTQRGLTAKTVRQHVWNIDFYINEYLLYEDATPAKDGTGSVSMYFSYWFIRKALWASAASIRRNAASLKKFYDFMAERKLVSEASVQKMKKVIKTGMPGWIKTVRRYAEWDGEDGGSFWGAL